MIIRIGKTLALILLLVWTWALTVYHMGTLSPPHLNESTGSSGSSSNGASTGHAEFFDRNAKDSPYSIHQLILTGDPYLSALEAGRFTKSYLESEERDLTKKLFSRIPEPWVMALEVPLIRYFSGIQNYIEPWMFQEMYGISKSAPSEFNRLIDPYTRQLAYHGLHEVGQLMVDQTSDDMGCTLIAVPFNKSWIIGRNFDFEGGRILDREKILSWNFPTDAHAYVSVTWAGIVGAVTAINDSGIYLSLNAAGSDDHRRLGMPSSLLLTKVMREATNAIDAIHILKRNPMFITDIFVLLDAKTGEIYRIEKSPSATKVVPLLGPNVVTNHLISPRFADDSINRFRRDELTSTYRMARAEHVLKGEQYLHPQSAKALELSVLNLLRDKGVGDSGRALNLGNRRAIDALIATHSIIFNAYEQILFVGQGPAVAGPFSGFDLKESFKQHKPIVSRGLPRDSSVSDEDFERVQTARDLIAQARNSLAQGNCVGASQALHKTSDLFSDSRLESPEYFDTTAMWDLNCQKSAELARQNWLAALDRSPAYFRDQQRIRKQLGSIGGSL